ncbi:putative mannan endo-1,4-beta-mannosidase 9 [Sesamum alatum]|uniref:mannan endo-1,4-beta-mannosidase n=1 Tax=Sesamum alatum TaxID=300844 RepID=A0AAE1Y2B5_9LAMI|nr:putative mannan endo-1,4-beta-mannosidase 9 [Sesamum alatum]
MWGKILGMTLVVAALLVACSEGRAVRGGFVGTRRNQFVVNGRPFYFNGFNSYWLMYMASDPSTRVKVSDTFAQAAKYGLNVARTWAFSDGGYRALQTAPGSYNEDMFKGLDFVVSEAKKHGIYLILSLVNNWEGFGGKKQYVEWARERGQYLNNEDEFFTNPIVKDYYKNHIKDWVAEMSAYVKSMDKNHLLEIGMEGFYGESMPEKKQNNPGYEVGTDFIANNRIPFIDFTTIHLYPDQWVPGSNDEAQDEFIEKWIQAHVDDSESILGKPLVVSEFGKSSRSSGYTVDARDRYFGLIFERVYGCARRQGPCGGALFWQVMAEGMENWSDGYEVVFGESPTTAGVIHHQSRRISSLNQ